MRNIFLISILCLFTLGGFILGLNVSTSTPTQISSPVNIVPTKTPYNEDTLWNLVQDWRTTNGKLAYIMDEKLCDYSAFRLEQIKRDWSHDGLTNAAPDMKKYTKAMRIGENLAEDYTNEQDTLNAWLNSPTHLENLTKPFTHSCIKANAKGDSVQLFATY